MEILDVLEERVRALVRQHLELREQVQRDNAASSAAVSGYAALVEENRLLREELTAARCRTDDAVHRLDALLCQLRDREEAL